MFLDIMLCSISKGLDQTMTLEYPYVLLPSVQQITTYSTRYFLVAIALKVIEMASQKSICFKTFHRYFKGYLTFCDKRIENAMRTCALRPLEISCMW